MIKSKQKVLYYNIKFLFESKLRYLPPVYVFCLLLFVQITASRAQTPSYQDTIIPVPHPISIILVCFLSFLEFLFIIPKSIPRTALKYDFVLCLSYFELIRSYSNFSLISPILFHTIEFFYMFAYFFNFIPIQCS